METWISRRRWIGLVAGALVSVGGFGATKAAMIPQETIVCWNEGSPYCVAGVLYQQQCCNDCAGTICDSLGCSDVAVGTC